MLLLPKLSSLSSSFFAHRLLSDAAAVAAQDPHLKPHFMVDYLICCFGFSPDKAAIACKRLNRIESLQQPESVLRFFRDHGFNDTQIGKLISWYPRWLRLSVEKTLAPKFQSLQDIGFSGSDLTHLILSNPSVLNLSFHRTVLPKIELWRGLLGSTDLLKKFLSKNQWLLSYSIEKIIHPNLTLLRDCGIPDGRISMVVKKQPRFILQKPDSFRALAERVEGLGISRRSRMFLWALQAVRMISEARFKARLELMKSLGWSELEFFAAVRRTPSFLSSSEKMIRDKMEFLVMEARCKPSYLALHPEILTYSLAKRMIPRNRVMQILKTRGLHSGEYMFSSIICISNEKFMEKYVLRHKEEVPELEELYTAGCAMGNSSLALQPIRKRKDKPTDRQSL